MPATVRIWSSDKSHLKIQATQLETLVLALDIHPAIGDGPRRQRLKGTIVESRRLAYQCRRGISVATVVIRSADSFQAECSGVLHANWNDRTRQDGVEHGATAHQSRTRVCGVRHDAPSGRAIGGGEGEWCRVLERVYSEIESAARYLAHGSGRCGGRHGRANCTAPQCRRHPDRRWQLLLRG